MPYGSLGRNSRVLCEPERGSSIAARPAQHRHDLGLEAPDRRPRILRHDHHWDWLRFPVFFHGTESRWREAADRETPGLEADHTHFLAIVQGNTDRLGERERPCFTGISVLKPGRQGRPRPAVDTGPATVALRRRRRANSSSPAPERLSCRPWRTPPARAATAAKENAANAAAFHPFVIKVSPPCVKLATRGHDHRGQSLATRNTHHRTNRRLCTSRGNRRARLGFQRGT